MDNRGKFKARTQFVGNINGVLMEVVKVVDGWKGTFREGRVSKAKHAIIKDLQSGQTFYYGLQALERCNVTILE